MTHTLSDVAERISREVGAPKAVSSRIVRERMRVEVRLQKIVELLLSCACGLTDLTCSKRMNIPFELSLMLALGKDAFATAAHQGRALMSISDLNFCDLHYHAHR